MDYLTGQAIRLSTGTITSDVGPTDPDTLELTITLPDLTTATADVSGFVRDGVGIYHFDFLPGETGDYVWRIVATGPNAAAEGAFTVSAPGDFETPSREWTPSTDDVAALLAQRTIDATGVPTGSFSDTTSPTDAQVLILVADVAAEILGSTGPIPDLLTGDAHTVAVLGTAAVIEATFDEGTSSLALFYESRYQAALARLTAAVAQVNDSGQVEPEGNPPQPLFNFPDLSDATTQATVW